MRIRTAFSLALIALAACCLARDGSSQQPADSDKPATVLKTPARDVVLPVTVHDKHGALVTSLQKNDLTLTEEGRPQAIKSFSRESTLPFRVGLLVETGRAMSGALEIERKAAGKFVDLLLPAQTAEGKEGAGKDQAFLIHFDREVELLEDFTGSREKLHQELDEMGPSRQAQNDTKGPETTGEDREERTRGGRGGNQLYDAIFLASDEVMGSKDGRKALVLFSDGVDRGSKDRLNEALDAAEKANLVIYTVYFKGEQERSENLGNPGGGGRHGGGYPGGGGGYPGGGGGYPGGGRRGGGGPDESGVDGRKIMAQIAERTGGHAYDAKKKEDLEPIYNQISEELHSQYLLTYTPDKPDTEGGFHKIALKANKDDVSVVAPEGYFAPGGEK
jgi:VWFA-related protein